MKTPLNTVARAYRLFTQRFGLAEPLVHASLVTYALLLLLTGLLNVLVPSFGVRHHLTHSVVARQAPRVLSSVEAARCITRALQEDEGNEVARRVRAEFACGYHEPQLYETGKTPMLGAVVHTSSKHVSVGGLARSLARYDGIQEVIICDDSGSGGERISEWAAHLDSAKDFVLRTNRLGPAACYNRALRLISADYIVFIPDDLLPATEEWISEALELLDADPKLGLLSGLVGHMWDPHGWYLFGEHNETLGHWGASVRRIPFLSKRTLKPFMYTECSWMGPLFLRRRALSMIGGFDHFPRTSPIRGEHIDHASASGDPKEWGDCILSYAMWTAGWRAGVFDADFRPAPGGTGLALSVARKGTSPPISDDRFDRLTIQQRALDLNDNALAARYDEIVGRTGSS